MSVRVCDLKPGDLVRLDDMGGIFCCAMLHPLYDGLMLVIWRLNDGSWSHDALSWIQDVGIAEGSNDQTRRERLRAAFNYDEVVWRSIWESR